MTPAVMISTPARAAERNKTLDQLDAVGIRPMVFLSPANVPATKLERNAEIHRNQRVALERGRDLLDYDDASHLLYIEDDVDIAPGFTTAIQTAIDHDFPALTLYLAFSDFRDYLDDDPMPGGAMRFHPVSSLRRWYGSQCIVLRCDVIDGLLNLPPGSIDTTLARMMADNGQTMYAVHPNLAQHRHEIPSEWMFGEFKQHYSHTFRQ